MSRPATLSNKQKADIVRDLLKVSFYQAGIRAGFLQSFNNRDSVSSAVRRVWLEVKSKPKKFGVSQEDIVTAEKAMVERSVSKSVVVKGVSKEEMELDFNQLDYKELMDKGAKKALVLLNKKFQMLEAYPKLLKNTPVSALAYATTSLFDKRQITLGQATEHIAVQAKISKDITPKERMDMLLNWREQNNQKNA